MEFKLNGQTIYKATYGGQAPTVLLPNLLSGVVNLEYWSEDALRQFLQGTLEMVIEFGHHVIAMTEHDLKTQSKTWHKREAAKRLRRKTANLMRKLTSHLRIVPHLKKEQLLKHTYDLLLSCDRLGPLRDFGMANKFGDTVMGNPEKHSIKIKE